MPSANSSTDFNQQALAFIDLETTGLRTTKDRITEIAIIRYQNGQELDRWSQLINPKMKIPEQIQHLTGINQAMIVDAPEFKEVADTVRDKLQGFTLIAAHIPRRAYDGAF